MNKIAFIFPGQGSQAVGMGQDLYHDSELARRRFHQANEILRMDLATLCFSGPEQQLFQTQYTQPALFVHSMILSELLAARGLHPDVVAGHSLGEYSAVTAAAALSFEEGLELVRVRGEAMQAAGTFQKGTMAAIIGLEEKILEEICARVSAQNVVTIANFNSPGQIVISGTVDGVHQAMEQASKSGAKRAIELKVSGAFHSPLMKPALINLTQKLSTVNFKRPAIPIYANVSAQPVQDPEDMRSLLERQLLSPVLWAHSVQRMISDGVDKFYEIGSGSVLTGLIRKINREVNVVSVHNLETLSLE